LTISEASVRTFQSPRERARERWLPVVRAPRARRSGAFDGRARVLPPRLRASAPATANEW